MCTYWKKLSLKKLSTKNNNRIDSIGIGLASPEEIRRWGERRLPNGTLVGKVDRDHTVDYESLKPIEGGLFCERIFGPVEDFYCSCERRGEKNEKFCPDCEVEFTKSRVRRTRMGYIPLAVPVAHVWYLRGRPSYIANLVGKSRNTIDKLAYGETLCESFVGNTSTNYFKDGLEHLAKSEKCRVLKFDSSNSNKVKTVSGNFKKIEKKDAKLTLNQNLFEWRSYYVQFLNCKVAFRPYSASAGFSIKNRQYENFRADKELVLSKKQMESPSIPATIKSHSSFSLNNFNPFIEQIGVTSPFFQDFAQITKKTFLINSITSSPFFSSPSFNEGDALKSKILKKRGAVKGESGNFNSEKRDKTDSEATNKRAFFITSSSFAKSMTRPSFKVKDFSNLDINRVNNQNVDNQAHNRMDKVNSLKNEPSLFSRSIDRQSSFPVLKNSINKTKIALSKNSFGLRQCNSDNQYPYKVDNHSAFLSDRFNNLAADVNKASLLSLSPSFTLPTVKEGDGKQGDVKEIYADSLNVNEINKENSRNTLQGKYNKFHTLPIFSTFIYKEWSHRFSFLEYFIWSARKNDLALPFYTRRGACHTARINSINLIRNKIGLKKTPKQFLFSFNGCTKNILWNERFQKVPRLGTITNKIGDNQNSKKIKKQLPKTIFFTGGDQGNEVKRDSTIFRASFDNRQNNASFPIEDWNKMQRLKKVDNLEYTSNLSDWFYSSGASKNISDFSQMPTLSPKSGSFLELRDKAVSLTLSVESNNLTKLLSTVNVKENPKQLETSSVVFRQMENFFAWESSLSSENVAVKNSWDSSRSVSLKDHALLDKLRSNLKELKDRSPLLFASPMHTEGDVKVVDQKSLNSANNNVVDQKELLTGMNDNFYTPSGKGVKKEGVQLKIKPKVSLASGNFRQLLPLRGIGVRDHADVNEEPSDKNRIQSTKWQKSSLMWGKVDDTQQFPRLAELLHFTGGKALRHLLSRFHLILLGKFLRHELKNLELKVNFLLALKILTYSQGLLLGKLAKRRSKQIRRLKLLELFQSKKSNPEWMILSVLPVLPPDLRPILRVNDDFVVASDLNRLYQTVLRRNNTIHERLDDPLPCPESGLFRQRSLQKAVDGLLENGKGGGTPLCASKRRPLVSLSHVLKGKKGLFRQHLLGKRVDYSGRSVIVVGPKLNLHECGLPKEMALELFQPFLIHRLKVKGLATSNTTARRMIQQEDPIIWHTVKQLVYEHPVLLNRAPTLHRLGIQAFQPRLVSGRAILLHPLVCNGFNADFDGDQMAVHVPLSFQARAEAWKIMWSKNNLLSPATGQPILVPSQDMVLGCYYLSVVVPRALRFPKSKKNVRVFSNQGDASKIESPQSAFSFGDRKKKDKINGDSFTITGIVNKKVSESFFFNYVKPVIFYSNQRKFPGNRIHQENSFTSPTFTLKSKILKEGDVKEGDLGIFKKTEIKNFSEYFKDKVNLFAKFSTVKSCKFINLPGYFKKTQHLGFLTNANLLQKIDTMEMSQKTSDSPPQTHLLPSSLISLRPVSFDDLDFVFDFDKQNESNITSNVSFTIKNGNEMQRSKTGYQGQFLRGKVNGNKVNQNNLCYWWRTTNIDKVKKKAGQWQETASIKNSKKHVNQFLEKDFSKKSDQTMVSKRKSTKNSAYLFERGHYFSSLHDSLMAYAQGRLQTHTPFWVRLDYSVANEKEKTSVLHINSLQSKESPLVNVPFSNPHGIIKRVLQAKETEIISLVDLQKKRQHPSLLQPRYGCSEKVSKVLFQEDHHRFVIEGNDTLETPLELRLGADGNLVKIFTTFQNHYSCNATFLDQCKEKSIRYMRTTAGRVVINETLFHF